MQIELDVEWFLFEREALASREITAYYFSYVDLGRRGDLASRASYILVKSIM
jgi:hypothetical protein